MKKRIIAMMLSLLLVCGTLLVADALGDAKNNTKKSGTVTITREEYERFQEYEKLNEIRAYIEAYYYKTPETQDMLDGAAQGLLYGLGDPYTFYYDEEAWSDLQTEETGAYTGIGIQLLGSYADRSVTITRVFRDTPAQAAGLRKGDLLVRVADIEVTVETMTAAVNIMRGTPGESVEVEVYREGEYITFPITRAEIHTNNVDYAMLENKVGYIILYQFTNDAFLKDFINAVDTLEAQGATSLILDLRDNPGGWVSDAVSVADRFLDKKLVVYSETRFGAGNKYYTQAGADDIPLVVLVNGSSASSSEILSGALQDYDRATIVGEKTFGKGVMQNVVELSDGKTGIQFTYCEYFTPLGNAVHGIGITPDIAAEMPEDMEYAMLEVGDMSDPQLQTAWNEAVKLAQAPAEAALAN